MLQPARTKYRKMMKGRTRGKATRGNRLNFGDVGLMALEPGWLTSRQIEAGRVALTRHVKRGGKLWIRIFPDKPITMKGNETPMGAGKGAVDHYVAPVRPGTVMFEMDGIPADKAKEALELAAYKLPCKAKYITTD